ncbi:MAG TPA: hypothetical protein VML96_07640, partial [Egibacteraceae bacterium]|nr:hypothetical protein [Egibacteraceae bacterium]
AVLTAVFVASYLTFLAVIGHTWTGRDTMLAVAGTLSMIGALVYLVAGLLTPRSPDAIGQVPR